MGKIEVRFFDRKAKEYVDNKVYLIDGGLDVCLPIKKPNLNLTHNKYLYPLTLTRQTRLPAYILS